MEEIFLAFGIKDAFCLYDDYSNNFSIKIGDISYPSVRHAVLSFKTNSKKKKETLAKILAPADLKAYELSLSTPKHWKTEYILELLRDLTLRKFQERSDFADKLIATGNDYLNDVRFTGQGLYDIEEIAHLPNYRGEILMWVRKILQ